MASTDTNEKSTKQTARDAATSDTTERTSTSTGTTPAHQRDPRVLAVDAAYAIAALGEDAVRAARTLPQRAGHLRDLDARRGEVEQHVRELRQRLEQRLEDKATEGRTIVDGLLGQPTVRSAVDQARTARTQVKAALTSIRRTATETVSAGVTAGRQQAGNARSQTKAATTSVRRTAAAAVAAGRQLVGDRDGDA